MSEPKPSPVSRSRYLLFLTIATVGCLVDLWTKHWVFDWRGMPRPNNEWWLWEPFVGIETAINSGALFGMGDGFGKVFAGLSIVAAIGILVAVFHFRAARDFLLTVALGAILGGILGNLYDRLGFWHPPGMPGAWRTEVRDWMLLRYGDFTWPNFNIADCLLVTGAALLMWRTYWDVEEPLDEASQGDHQHAGPSKPDDIRSERSLAAGPPVDGLEPRGRSSGALEAAPTDARQLQKKKGK